MVRSSIAPYAVVIDDNPVILLHATELVVDAGFSVFSATGSDDGLAWLENYEDEVVLVITNVEIPGPLTGFELARVAASRWPQMGIVVTSGRFSPEPGDMPNDAVFMPKPFSATHVLRAIGQALETKNARLTSLQKAFFGPVGWDEQAF